MRATVIGAVLATALIFSGTPMGIRCAFAATAGESTVAAAGSATSGEPYSQGLADPLKGAGGPFDGNEAFQTALPGGEDDGPLMALAATAAANETTGRSYGDFAEALADAQAGDTLRLVSDCTVDGSFEADTSLTVDLAGHRLTVNAGAQAGSSAQAAALTVSGPKVSITGPGTLAVTVGATPETNNTARFGYCGIRVAEGASLTLDGCAVTVAYEGASIIKPAFDLQGIVADGGSVSFQGAASLTVVSSATKGAYGASEVCALAGCADGCIDGGSAASLRAINESAPITKGIIGYPYVTGGTNSGSNAALIEVQCEEGSPFYKAVAERFAYGAAFDGRADDEGLVFGANIYYASAMTLADGLTVWAYSDGVEADKVGTAAAIVPDHVFVRSDYQIPCDAFAVAAKADFAGSVTWAGTAEAVTDQGRAIASLTSGKSRWNMAGSRLSARCGNRTYRALDGAFDLRDYLDLKAVPDKAVSYPLGSRQQAVRQAAPVAAETADASSLPTGCTSDPIAYGALFADPSKAGTPEESHLETDGVTLVYFRKASDGYLYTSERIASVASGADAMAAADARVKPGDTLTVGSITYRFKGWSTRRSDKDPLFTESLPTDALHRGNGGGRMYFGIYDSDERTVSVRFWVNGEPYAQAADIPVSKTLYSAFTESDNPAQPESPREDEVFRGWALHDDDDAIIRANMVTLASLVPEGDALEVHALWKPATEKEPEENGGAGAGGENPALPDGTGGAAGGSSAGTGGAAGILNGSSAGLASAPLSSSGSRSLAAAGNPKASAALAGASGGLAAARRSDAASSGPATREDGATDGVASAAFGADGPGVPEAAIPDGAVAAPSLFDGSAPAEDAWGDGPALAGLIAAVLGSGTVAVAGLLRSRRREAAAEAQALIDEEFQRTFLDGGIRF